MRTTAIVLLAMVLGGCVERRITFTSDPPGAIVIVSDKEIGRTPVTLPFTWYGDYEILYRMKGYQTIRTHATINPPWYEVPPVDLFSYMAPWTYHDDRFFHQQMEKLSEIPDKELIERAERMERRILEPERH